MGDIKKRHGVNIKMEIYSWAVNTPPTTPKNVLKSRKSAILGIQTCLPWPKNDNTILEEKTIQSGIIYLK